jgi:hypothetical protein
MTKKEKILCHRHLNVDFQDFAERRKLLVEVVGRHLPGQVADVEGPRGLGVVLVQVAVRRPVV